MSMKNSIPILIITFVSITMAVGCTGRGESGAGMAVDTVMISTDTVRASQMAIPVITSGLLATETEVKLSFKTGGLIGSLPVREGQSLKKGELIASLDLSELNSVVNQYRLAQEKAERDLRRAQNLFADSVTTLETLQNAKTAHEMATSMLEASLFNLEKSVIKAPTGGKVLKKLAEKGEITGAGHPIVLFAPDNGEWIISSGVSDKNIVRIETGDSATVKLDAFPEFAFTGTVTETGSFADPYTGAFTVKTSVNDPDKAFRTGMTARVTIIPSRKEKMITVPVTILSDTGNDAAYVYLLTGGSWNKTRVITGEITGDRIVVREGLKEGDVFITEGMSYLTPGCIVKPANR